MKNYYYGIAGILLTISAWITIKKSNNTTTEGNVAHYNMNHENHIQNKISTSTQGRNHSQTKNSISSPERITDVQYKEQVQERIMASIDTLYSKLDEPQKQQTMEELRENLLAAYHLPHASEKLKEFFQEGPADIVNELLFDVSEIQHPMQVTLWRAAADRNDSHINGAILLHLEQQSGEIFDNIDSALSWASNKAF